MNRVNNKEINRGQRRLTPVIFIFLRAWRRRFPANRTT
ncbi:hypothetical protein D088_850077 [Salmonella enterica subsp. houtenae serovar 16:z4,z32:-- str. RKS3027]|nr:hypothetical protein D088_850077 [Salmonella enterica subsp. houtenae serovar 16:z4,z32:-- str. RKS3027]